MIIEPGIDKQPRAQRERAGPRRAVFYGALLMIDGRQVTCRIRDLSIAGAMIEAVTPLAVGAKCALDLPKIGEVVSTVVWTDTFRSGIAFDPLLTRPQIESIFPVLPTEPILYAPRPVPVSPDNDWRRGTTDAGAKFRARSAVARLRDSNS